MIGDGPAVLGPAVQTSATQLKGFRALLRVIRRFVPYLRPLWDKVLLRIVMAQCGAFLGLLGVMASANVIDRAIPQKSVSLLLFWSGVALLLTVAGTAFQFLNGIIGLYVGIRLDIRFKELILRHIHRLSLRFYDSRPVGEHMFRVSSDTAESANLIGGMIPTIIERLQGILTALGLLLVVNPVIALAVAAYVILYFAYSHFLGSRARATSQLQRIRAQEVLAVLQQNLSAFVLAKAFGRERRDLRRYYGRSALSMRAALRFNIIISIFSIGALLMQAFYYPLVHWLFCGLLVVRGDLTLGEYVALGQILTGVTVPLEFFIMTIQMMRIQAVPAERMLDTLEVAPDPPEVRHAVKLENPRGEIEFDRVSFRYTDGGPEVLRELSFKVKPGTKLAIVGLSGAGKTTVFNLLMRFYDPTAGRVLIDGHDLREVNLASYRNNVGLVLQDNFLFSASIADNVRFGKLDASDDEVWDAIRRAGLAQYVESLPAGMDTVLAEGGNLSSGQKQRLAIARAIIRNPKFLYLDEATSALDPATEEEILAQLRLLETGRTRLVIAHNIMSIADADEILLLERGVLRRRGTHAELLAADETYAAMWAAEQRKAERIRADEVTL